MKMILSLMIALSALYADFSRDDTAQIVTDNATGLQWQDDAAGTQMGWTAAISECETLELGTQTDWRLPNISELKSIADKSRVNPAIDPVFQNTVSYAYWSATTYEAGPQYAWLVYFYLGYGDANVKGNSRYVRCVRGGQ